MPLKFFSLAFLSFPALAQQAAQPDTTLQVLLNEVHALRIALEKSNQIGPRIQIALARMQFQEQRVRDAARQVEAARGEVINLQSTRTRLEDSIKTYENRQGQIVDPATKTAMEQAVTSVKAELERLTAQEPQLRAREAEANSALSSEQAKWNEINDVLVSMERVLK